jgi:small subunit ribosomal protein S14
MSNLRTRDYARRSLVARYELQRLQYRATVNDRNLPTALRLVYLCKLAKMNRNSSKTRIRNRCTVTGRGRSVLSQFRVSRIVFRELANRGLIPGIIKSSW